MKAPFIKEEKGGISIRLHQALYPHGAIGAFKDLHQGGGLVVTRVGTYWALKMPGCDESDGLEALDHLLGLSKSNRT